MRLNQPASPPSQIHSLGPEDLCFIDKANHLVTCHRPNTDGQPSFSESWPSTDLGSSPPNTRSSSNMEAPRESGPAGKSSVSSDQGYQQDSVLSKYTSNCSRQCSITLTLIIHLLMYSIGCYSVCSNLVVPCFPHRAITRLYAIGSLVVLI